MIQRTSAGPRLTLVIAACIAAVVGATPSPSVAAPSDTTDDSAPGAAELNVVESGLDAAVGASLSSAAAGAFGGVSAPGAAMAVRTPDGTWVATIGTQDLDGTTPMTADLNQRIGSITKTFTVTAVLQLADEGALSLDDPIGDFVGGTPNPDATLGQLAAMRSGSPSYTFDEEFQEQLFGDPNRVWTPEQLVDFVRGREADFAPGEATSYSNTNTVLLGLVIEDVTGQPIDEV